MKRFIFLALVTLLWGSAWGQMGSDAGHGYLYLNGNTDTYPNSIFRFVKWSGNNAHIDVMDGNSLMLNFYSGGHVFFGRATGASHSVFQKNGILGINTLSPASGFNLHVNGKSLFTGLLKIGQASGVNNSSPGITCRPNDDFLYNGEYINHYGFGFHRFSDPGNPSDGRNAYVSGYFGINFFTSGKSRLRLCRNGNVGIGTSRPKSTLDVNGTIRATEIKVVAQTADFVFSDNYPLLNLEQVEDYIKEHKHLPDIPSADEMEASGVNLAEMNKLLLQKIEELTLYAIEKNKEITGLKEKQREEDEMKNMQEKEMKNLTRQISKMEEENIKVNERLKVIEALITESIGR